MIHNKWYFTGVMPASVLCEYNLLGVEEERLNVVTASVWLTRIDRFAQGAQHKHAASNFTLVRFTSECYLQNKMLALTISL